MTSLEYTGLDTQKALEKLKSAITKELQIYENATWKKQSCMSALGHQSGWELDPRAAFHWTSGTAIMIAILLLLLSSVCSWDPSLLVESSVLFMFLLFNAYLSGWDVRLQHREMVDRTKELIKYLEEMTSQEVTWSVDDYMPLFSPHTNSIMLQWTLRDGQLVNLPWTLLVTDDIILMRPGKIAPTNIRILSEESDLELQPGEIYHPITPEATVEPTARQPLPPAKFQVMDTPYIPHLRTCLKGAQKKPLSSFDNKRVICTAVFERWLTPAALIISFVINMIRYLILESDMGHWAQLFIAIPVHTVLPLLPLSLPLIWISLNHFGSARIVTLFHKSKHLKMPESDREFQDSDEDTQIADESLPWLPVWRAFKASFLGTSAHLPRTGNLLQGLGSVTSLCCVDKRGILSTPDPTPEKVFFMSSLSDDDTDSVCSEDSVFGAEDGVEKGKKRPRSKLVNEDHFPEHHAEVLTLSQDSSGLFGVEFDETNWDRHISSLKPMGLTILMNTCNANTVETYCSFMDHVCSSVNNEDSKHYMHVSQRRCLCQIAQVMGFTEQATEAYQLKQKLALYKLPSDADENDTGGRRFARSRSFIKKRIPAPHTLSVLVQQSATGCEQLLTQGSASLLLDLCSEFWDGSDLFPLTENESKKILDFYQRATLSSYCTAFAYQPMAEAIDSRLGDYYIELPGNHKRAAHPYIPEIPGLARSSWDMDTSREPNSDVHRTRKYHSLDSTMNKHATISNAEECYKSQCGQIFIGMVTSNYQAKSDIVALIEQLDNACIRFVHFSRDQELRSRVFSEKLGLEAGWNCHISLLHQDNSTSNSSHNPPTGDISRQYSSHSSSGHDNTITDGEMSNRQSDTGEVLKSDETDASPQSAEETQVQMEVEAQRVRFDPVEAVVVVDMESLIGEEPEEKSDAVARQQTDNDAVSVGNQRELPESGGVSMRASSGPHLGRPCSRDADTEDANEEDEDDVGMDKDEEKGQSSSSQRDNRTQKTQHLQSESERNLKETSCAECPESKEEDALLGNQNQNATSSDPSSPSSPSSSIPTTPSPTEAPNANSSEDAKETDALLSQPSAKSFDLSNRQRQISETHTVNSDAETDTLSHQTESETAGGFDISNRAKLPRGIANIRPHIERIDNVPLLVPLFTDVTPETTREMVEIMQENGEVVCCLGSSLNITNAPILAQADISIGMEPLPPHICMSKEHAHPKTPPNWTSSPPLRSPLEVTSLLTSLPCSLSFHRLDNISLISLIREARGICNGIVNCFMFFMFGLLTLSAIQLLCTLLFLPPPLSGRHVLWLASVIVPLLAVALMGSNSQSKVMTQATGKNIREHNTDHVVLFCFYFITKFLGSVVICTVCHSLTLFAFCKKTTENPEGCHFILHNRNMTSSWNGWKEDLSSHHVLAQNIQTFLLTMYFITSSASFVHCIQPLWRKPPFRNHLWCAVALALFLLEIIYFAIDMSIWGSADAAEVPARLGDIPLEVWLIGFLWPLVVLFLCEAVKQYEIQVFVRWQKRTKLQFGTKLGMNSPF